MRRGVAWRVPLLFAWPPPSHACYPPTPANASPRAMCLASQTSPNISNLIEHGNLRFILMDAPNDGNLLEYLQAINKHNVTDIVRACEQTYGDAEAAKMGMTCHVSARCAFPFSRRCALAPPLCLLL